MSIKSLVYYKFLIISNLDNNPLVEWNECLSTYRNILIPELFIFNKFNIKKKVIKHIYLITFYVIRNDKQI